MEQQYRTKIIRIKDMTCIHCQQTIEIGLKETPGVKEAAVNYTKGTAKITYDEKQISADKLSERISMLGYEPEESEAPEGRKLEQLNRMLGCGVVIVAGYILLQHTGLANLSRNFPQAEEGMAYGMLFLIGLLTSVHCIAMCGGICLSQCIPGEAQGKVLQRSALYNVGRVISYTVVGALVGTLGSVISFSGMAKGIVQIAAGMFMVIMGLTMTGMFPMLRKFQIRMPGIFTSRQRKTNRRPLYAGLLNGLMPCGPLQAMQLYALSTGHPLKGALAMFLFSAGTVPLMFGFGALSSLLSRRFNRQIMTAGAVLVVILGISMTGNGVALSGLTITPAAAGESYEAMVEDGVQIVEMNLEPGTYAPILVREGVPVRWIIQAERGTINGCNDRIFIPEYGIEHTFQEGRNVIEFLPEQAGTYAYSCWMGMIRSTITVTE